MKNRLLVALACVAATAWWLVITLIVSVMQTGTLLRQAFGG